MIKLLLSISCVLLFTGCTVSQHQLASAEKVCAAHGGIFSLSVDNPFVDVTCRDGAYFNNVRGDIK